MAPSFCDPVEVAAAVVHPGPAGVSERDAVPGDV